MATRRFEVLAALQAMLMAALPFAEILRNAEKPERLAAGGTIILRDGDPGEPDILLSPLSYTYSHRVSLEVAPFLGEDPEGALDSLCAQIGAALQADRTLGGLTEWLEAEAPDVDEVETLGAEGVLWAEIGVLAVYSIPSPLG